MKFPKSVLVLTAGLFGAFLAVFALGVSKAVSAPLNNDQLQLLFSGSEGRANGPDCWELGMQYVGTGYWDFKFKKDGTFKLHYICLNAYNDDDFNSSGRWRLERNKFCIEEDGDLFSRFGVKSPDKCFLVNSERIFYEARDSSNRTIWYFRIFNPKLPLEYSDQLTELKKLYREPSQTGEPLNTKEAKAREAEIARLRQEIKKVEKARQAEIARLKKEAEEARKSPDASFAAVPGKVTLPPAEYKPLPVGTEIKYDNRFFSVARSEGFTTVFQTFTGGRGIWLTAHALFGETADNLHGSHPRGDNVSFSIDSENRKKLEGLWPLKVGKKISYTLNQEAAYWMEADSWEITLEVLKTETLELNGLGYPTYVIEEEGRSETGKVYVGRKWYQPESGLVIKAERTWRKSFPSGNEYYQLAPDSIRAKLTVMP